ncbi:hypothetical protein ILYODFUR_034453 [Ilyodon furcidens]|uniref:Uncharacterized protein n=1 Tax=Ilyodon furcidens TaxID=33524 RepID=A0ABV0U1Z1_9TELE
MVYIRCAGTENYNHIIISTAPVAATAVLFGLYVLMVKKYKKRIQELQSQDGRLPSGASGPTCSNQSCT